LPQKRQLNQQKTLDFHISHIKQLLPDSPLIFPWDMLILFLTRVKYNYLKYREFNRNSWDGLDDHDLKKNLSKSHNIL